MPDKEYKLPERLWQDYLTDFFRTLEGITYQKHAWAYVSADHYQLWYKEGKLELFDVTIQQVVAYGAEALTRFDELHQEVYGYSCLSFDHLPYLCTPSTPTS